MSDKLYEEGLVKPDNLEEEEETEDGLVLNESKHKNSDSKNLND